MKVQLTMGVAVLLMGCAGISARAPEPAIIVGANAASRTELQQLVSRILRRDSVVLADNALTESSDLTIEPARPRDDAGRLLDGRDLRTPERFRLTIDGARCYLRHEGSGQRYLLAATRCIASRAAPSPTIAP